MKKKKKVLLPQKKKKKLPVNPSPIKRADVKLAFKEPEVKPVAVKVEAPKVRKFRFETDVELDKVSKIALTRLFLNHERIIKYAEGLLNERKFNTLSEFREVVNEYITSRGLTPVIPSSINIDLFYMLKKKDKVGKKRRGKFFIPFVEDRFTNKRFTISNGRDRLFFEHLDVVLKLKNSIPTLLEDGTNYYLNIAVRNCTNLEGLFINIFSDCKA